jgi:NAD(P)-dependent dehydrogenase (short-subunit alcohol dehydrogenase family)
VGQEADLERLAAAALERFGSVDIWCSNAGKTVAHRSHQLSPGIEHAPTVQAERRPQPSFIQGGRLEAAILFSQVLHRFQGTTAAPPKTQRRG